MVPTSTPAISDSSASGPVTGSLWLVRHGESTWNTLGLTQGQDDQAELTAQGRRQAAEVAERFAALPVRSLYASDLRRTQQTAAPIAAAVALPVMLDPRLRERNLGVLEGTPAAGNGPVVTGLDLEAGRLVDPDTRPPGGESVRDLYQRAAAFALGAVFAQGAPPPSTPQRGACAAPLSPPAGRGEPSHAPPAGDVVVVAHGGTLRVLRAYLSGIPVEDMDWGPLPNATVLQFTLQREETK